jgi:hypothetical protein
MLALYQISCEMCENCYNFYLGSSETLIFCVLKLMVSIRLGVGCPCVMIYTKVETALRQPKHAGYRQMGSVYLSVL